MPGGGSRAAFFRKCRYNVVSEGGPRLGLSIETLRQAAILLAKAQNGIQVFPIPNQEAMPVRGSAEICPKHETKSWLKGGLKRGTTCRGRGCSPSAAFFQKVPLQTQSPRGGPCLGLSIETLRQAAILLAKAAEWHSSFSIPNQETIDLSKIQTKVSSMLVKSQ